MQEAKLKYHQLHPEKAWAYKLKTLYDLTPEGWGAMLIAQCGRCAACGDPMEDPYTDHDHETGNVRALLCRLCNLMLGSAKDSPERLRAGAAYLEKHNGNL